jgi:hypothetical protein
LAIASLSQTTYATSILPAGFSTNSYQIACHGYVYDVLSSSSTASTYVTGQDVAKFFSSTHSRSSERLVNFSSDEIDGIVRDVNLLALTLNQANSSATPASYCSALNRFGYQSFRAYRLPSCESIATEVPSKLFASESYTIK